MRAIIVDLDGTLSESQHVDAFTDVGGKVDWTAWMESTKFAPVKEWCREIVLCFQSQGFKIVFLTARNGGDHGRGITRGWLDKNGFFGYDLYMRSENDYRPDRIIKAEIYNRDIAPKYDVLFAVDDKRAVCDMWRDLGITALHCADY